MSDRRSTKRSKAYDPYTDDVLKVEISDSDDWASGDEIDGRMASTATEARIFSVMEKYMARRLVPKMKRIFQQQAALVLRQESDPRDVEAGPSFQGTVKANVKQPLGVKVLKEFDPDDPTCEIDNWLHQIDEHADKYGWSHYERAAFMQTKLVGGARDWWQRLDSYDLTWEEWKVLLIKVFSQHVDFGAMIYELATRCKLPNESISHYFNAKLALCEKCGIDGTKAVSCILHGLPEELRMKGYSYGCETPEALYSMFLAEQGTYQEPRGSIWVSQPVMYQQACESGRNDYQKTNGTRFSNPDQVSHSKSYQEPNESRRSTPEQVSHPKSYQEPNESRRSTPDQVSHPKSYQEPNESKRSNSNRVSQSKPPRERSRSRRSDHDKGSPPKASRREPKKIRCFNCQEYGDHISKDCPRPRVRRCMICLKEGHSRLTCPEDRDGEIKRRR